MPPDVREKYFVDLAEGDELTDFYAYQPRRHLPFMESNCESRVDDIRFFSVHLLCSFLSGG